MMLAWVKYRLGPRSPGLARAARAVAPLPSLLLALLLALLAVALVGSLAVLPAQAITIEIDDVASDRVERQRAFAAGALPLPGTPDLAQLKDRMDAKGFKAGGQLFLRVFKSESELEVWMRKDDRFELLATYPICHWAGTIGPKLAEGDKQNPEGFYSVGARQLHRIGRWPRSLNLGFPNSFDRAWGRTGSYILVHGGCSSVGCFAMTNAVMSEIFALSEQSLRAGQQRIEVHVFPFRMTDANLAQHANSPWIDFWRNLKEGYDAFEETRLPPRVGLCDRRYVIDAARPPEVGQESPLASCGALRAALVEPSSQSLALHLPPDWPQQPQQAMATAPMAGLEQPQPPPVQQAEYSGQPLSPLPPLAEQALLLPPRVNLRSPSLRSPSLRSPSLRSPSLRLAALSRAASRAGSSAEPLLVPIAAAPPCNTGLASCRKFLALKSKIEQQRIAAVQRSRGPRGTRVAEAPGRPATSGSRRGHR